MVVKSHLGTTRLVYLEQDRVRAELLDRGTQIDGDEVVFSNGRLLVMQQGCAALILTDVEVVSLTGTFVCSAPRSREQFQSDFLAEEPFAFSISSQSAAEEAYWQ